MKLSPQARFQRQYDLWESYWRRFGLNSAGVPDFSGKRILDFGCGFGAFSIRLAEAGAASVVGLDIDRRRLTHAQENLCQNYPHFEPNITFVLKDIAELDVEPFDIIVTHEVFEHVLELDEVLGNLSRILKSGGRMYASWGPLWNSITGGHALMRFNGMLIPFGHRIFTKQSLKNYAAKHPKRTINTIRDVGLNGLSLRDYERHFSQSPFEVVSWKSNRGASSLYPLFNILAGLPLMREAFTLNVYAVFERTA